MPPIKIINAGAGSGKTYRLTEEVFNAIKNNGVNPEKILLTTFTIKAASELKERVSEKLLNEGMNEEAMLLRQARIGTVHSICSPILDEFALDAGISVRQKVLSKNETKILFNETLTSAVSAEMTDKIRNLSDKLDIEDWKVPVENIVAKARSNFISEERLPQFAVESFQELFKNIGDQNSQAEMLLNEVEKVIAELSTKTDLKKITKGAINNLKAFIKGYKNGHLKWSMFNKLASLNAGAPYRDLMHNIHLLSSRHYEWPEFKNDIEQFLKNVFKASQLSMKAYQEHKQEQGYLDFNDLEQLGLQVLDNPEIKKAISLDLDLVMIDEFQDTSPIQLQLFLELSKMAKQSIWVGDPKQSIYQFRGADPELMFAVTNHIEKHGETATLGTSYRSRPELVKFVNEIFKDIFPNQNIAAEKTVLKANREKELTTPALESWLFPAGKFNIERGAVLLANQIVKMLQQPELHPVIDRKTKIKRPLQASDITILAPNHTDCEKVANALKDVQIRVERATRGILEEPEIELALAGLKLMLRPDDTLSAARITFFHSVFVQSKSKDEWLKKRLLEYQEQKNVKWQDPMLQEIREAASELHLLSPSEALQTSMELTKAFTFASHSKSTQKRIGNLETLLNHARDYENQGLQIEGHSTISGFFLYLRQLEVNELDTQAFETTNSVKVGTFHSSKGLEWNMVILFQLDKNLKDGFFGISSGSDCGLDITSPLKNRNIQYFPKPYNKQTTNSEFIDKLKEDNIYNIKLTSQINEKIRLFYVLFTRARDYLIFAAQPNKLKSLEILKKDDESNALKIPQNIQEIPKGWQVIELETSDQEQPKTLPPDRWFQHSQIQTKRPKAHLTPSKLKVPTELKLEVATPKPIKFAEKYILEDKAPDNVVGDAVHLYLGIDKSKSSPETKIRILKRLLKRMNLEKALPVDNLIKQCNVFEQKITELWPDATIYREWPISFQINGCTLSGSIDFLLETEKGFIIIDHKTFHGDESYAQKHALKFAPQMAAYSEAIFMATNKPIIATYINFILLGFLQELTIKNKSEFLNQEILNE